jgi:lambda repressor-like predicted transcriptional regulator
MHPYDIQNALKKKGITQVAISRDWGVSGVTVSKVVRSRDTRYVAKDRMVDIARRLDMPVEAVFPWYYVERKSA